MSMHAKNQVNKNPVKTPENESTREHVMLLKILWKPPRMVHQQQPAGFKMADPQCSGREKTFLLMQLKKN